MLTTYEAAGAVMTGAMPASELDALERAAVPTFGACPGQFTANTMGMVSEVLGLAPLGSSMIPAVYEERGALATRAGHLVMAILEDGGPLPRDLVTKTSLDNACAIVAATGGSTNAALHIPAIAHEAGIRFTLDDVAAVFERTPLIGNLRPGGDYHAQDVYRVGGVPMIAKALIASGHLDGATLTLSGETLEQACAERPSRRRRDPRPADPLSPTGGVVVLKGNLAPDGALLKSQDCARRCMKVRRACSRAKRSAWP